MTKTGPQLHFQKAVDTIDASKTALDIQHQLDFILSALEHIAHGLLEKEQE